MTALGWLIIAVILLVIEMITPGIFFFACFSAGAFLASLATLLGAPAWLAWTVFFASSIMLIFTVAPLVRRWMKKTPSTPVGLDSLEGSTGHVIEQIDPSDGKGQVRLSNGAIWRAISTHTIPEGSQVDVLGIKGTRLEVKLRQDSLSS